ncbi:MAG: dUTP diphosphatase [Desulfitobacteriaceae bacterium]
MESCTVKFCRVRKQSALPVYATNGAAGVDLCASLDGETVIQPGQVAKVPTGLAMELPNPGIVALVCARSGLAAKHGISLANGVGVVDSDYRGEIQVLLINQGTEPFTIHAGDRIAQMLFIPILQAELEVVEELTDTQRGRGGFGSTGI